MGNCSAVSGTWAGAQGSIVPEDEKTHMLRNQPTVKLDRPASVDQGREDIHPDPAPAPDPDIDASSEHDEELAEVT